MSPLFHHGDSGTDSDAPEQGHVPSLAELGPQLDEVVQSASALPLAQFASQLMTRYFTADAILASGITSMVAVDPICWDLLPENSGQHASEQIPDAFFSLQDIVTEALQLLRNSGLVMERSYKVGQGRPGSQWLSGLVTTRRGRSALADGSVGQILAQAYAPAA